MSTQEDSMFEHPPELTFRLSLLFLTTIIYAARAWYVVKSKKRVTFGTISSWVMGAWALSLLAYVFGFLEPLHLTLPVQVRWFGAACMSASFPLMWVWMYDSIGGYFSSRINLGSDVFSDFGWHRLRWNPMFMTFCLCAFGAVLLSANSVVLMTSAFAMLAMASSMKKEFAANA